MYFFVVNFFNVRFFQDKKRVLRKTSWPFDSRSLRFYPRQHDSCYQPDRQALLSPRAGVGVGNQATFFPTHPNEAGGFLFSGVLCEK